MEFPEVVAANPALLRGITANPKSVGLADEVALACLITSPAASARLAKKLESLALRLLNEYRKGLLKDYLDLWRERSCPKLAVDVSRLAAASDLSDAFERAIRGRSILMQRVRCEQVECRRWKRYLPRSDEGEDGVFLPCHPSSIDPLSSWFRMQVKRAKVFLPRHGAGGDPFQALPKLDILRMPGAAPGSRRGTFFSRLQICAGVQGGFGKAAYLHRGEMMEGNVLAEFEGNDVLKCTFEANDNERELCDFDLPAGWAKAAGAIIAPWREAAQRIKAGEYLVIDSDREVRRGTPSEIRLALIQVREEDNDEDARDDTDGEEATDGSVDRCRGSIRIALEMCVDREAISAFSGAYPSFVRRLRAAPFTLLKLGGRATVKNRLTELANTLPRPSRDSYGVESEGDYQFLIMDGKKYAALFIGPIERVRDLYENVRCELDVMKDASSSAQASFSGMTVVVTGFGSAARAELEDLLIRAGAIVTHSVSGKTEVLIVGAKPGPEKLEKARTAGAEVIDEATARTRLAS
jgi:hypothetical protein